MASRQDIAALRSMFDRVLAASASKPKPRRGRRANRPALTAASQPQASQPRRPRRRRAANTNGGNAVEGSIRIRRTEFLLQVKHADEKNSSEGTVVLSPASFAWLKGVASSFDRIVWHSARLEYRPYASVTNDGGISIGMDWNFKSKTSKSSVLACTPNVFGPVYQKLSMNLPASQLQSRKFYTLGASAQDLAPGQLIYSVDSKDKGLYCGDVFIHYDITLSGTSGA